MIRINCPFCGERDHSEFTYGGDGSVVYPELDAPAELWLDGGHNPAAGAMLAATLREQPTRPTHLICGMLNTKDIAGYLKPLAEIATTLTGVSIPDETNTIPGSETARIAQSVGIVAHSAETVADAIAMITAQDRNARILICGSLYFAGHVIRQNQH